MKKRNLERLYINFTTDEVDNNTVFQCNPRWGEMDFRNAAEIFMVDVGSVPVIMGYLTDPNAYSEGLNVRVSEKMRNTEIIKARKEAGLTQKEAAAAIGVTLSSWQRYEYGERKMHPAFWELFKMKTGMGSQITKNL